MTNKKNAYLDVDDSNDFGFTFTNEEEITEPIYSTKDDEIDDLKQRLHALRKIFQPLLENLAKDPDKPMIKWPNRKDILDKQIKKLMNITNV